MLTIFVILALLKLWIDSRRERRQEKINPNWFEEWHENEPL